jgi:AraC family ethanolamine operon transcriptional activator
MRVVTANTRRHSHFDRGLELHSNPIPGWDTGWIHLGPGPMAGDSVRVPLGSGSLAVFHTTSAGILRGSTARDSTAMLTGLDASNGPPRALAQPIGGNMALSLPPGAVFDLYLPEDSGVMVFTVPPSDTAESTRAECRPLDATPCALLARCADSLEAIRAGAAASRPINGAQRDLLQSTAAALFPDSGPPACAHRESLQRHRAVVRASAFIEANLRVPIALADLCAASDVCTRALEYGFRDFYALGPMAYVRNLRLCRVRHDLLAPERGGESVGSAARRWGFTHMGQFSHDYRVLFMEMPSETLARRQHQSADPAPCERKLARSSDPR